MKTFKQLTYSGPGMLEDPPQEAFASQIEPQAGLSMVQIISIVRAYWIQTLAITLTVSIVAAGIIKFLPKTYTATATLIVNTDSKDPLAGQQFSDGGGNYVATQIELMTSSVILLPVVDRLNLTNDVHFTAGFRGGSPTALRDYVEKNLVDQLLVETGRGGELLYVSASAENPDQAAEIANAVADSYLQESHKRINGPAGERAQRYSEELAELRAKAIAAQDKVTEFRKHNGLTDVTAAGSDNETQALSTLESKLLEAQDARRALESKKAGQQSTADEALASTNFSELQMQLKEEQTQLAHLSATMGQKHPSVIELRSQIALTQEQMTKEVNTLSGNNATELSRARDLEDKLTRAIAEQRTKVLNLRQVQDAGAKLELELESAQSVYKRALDGYDQIMFASVGNYSTVSFISRATPPIVATKPKKSKLMMISAIVGLLFGIAVPMAYELFLNRRQRCSDDLERDFAIPVLAQFERVRMVEQ